MNKYESITVPLDDLFEMPYIFCQRDHQKRIEKGKADHLKKYKPEHAIGFVFGQYDEDTKIYHDDGSVLKVYEANKPFKMDGNTRSMMWESGEVIMDTLPDMVMGYITTFSGENRIQDSKEAYYRCDSTSATESTSDKIDAFLLRKYNNFYIKPKESGMKSSITLALGYASVIAHKGTGIKGFTQIQLNDNVIESVVKKFAAEIIFLHDNGVSNKKGRQFSLSENPSIFACLLLAAKRYMGTSLEGRFVEFLNKYQQGHMVTGEKLEDGVTKIVFELYSHNKFERTWSTLAGGDSGMERTMQWVLYCIEKFMIDEPFVNYADKNGRKAVENFSGQIDAPKRTENFDPQSVMNTEKKSLASLLG